VEQPQTRFPSPPTKVLQNSSGSSHRPWQVPGLPRHPLVSSDDICLKVLGNGHAGVVRQRLGRHHTAQPYMNKNKPLRDIKGKHGAPFGETIMQNATEGTTKKTTYWWPKRALREEDLLPKVGDQICGVGYYKE
jgi:hypothetical protein